MMILRPANSYPRWIDALLGGFLFLSVSACALFGSPAPAVETKDLEVLATMPAASGPTASLPALEAPPTLELPTLTPAAMTPTARPLTGTPEQPPDQPSPTALLDTPTPVIMDLDQQTWVERSPDGQWEAIGTVALPSAGEGDSYYTRLEVLSLLGEAAWVVGDEWRPLGLGYTTPRVLAWSADGTYLYLTERPVPDGCAIYVNGSDLQRLDLATGELETLAPPLGLWLTLSPEETRLAYIGYGGRGLVFRDLATGTEQELSLDPGEPYAAGDITWAPDGSAVVVGLGFSPCAGDWAGGVALVRVDLPSLTQTELLPVDERLFRIMEWDERGIALQDKEGDLWLMDPQTGALAVSG